jgi:hypothetical protein
MSDNAIWQAASSLIYELGENAALVATQLSNEALSIGDKVSWRYWLKVAAAVMVLMQDTLAKQGPMY